MVDGTWDNPNYWFRYSLLRSALGLASSQEVGVIGPYARRAVAGTFEQFDIKAVCDITQSPLSPSEARLAARRLLARTREPSDILRWELPEQLPASIIYDGILKRQRSATVDLRDSDLVGVVAEALQAIAAVTSLLEQRRPSLVVLSHAINFHCGALAWGAARRGIPAIVIYGNYGVPRFWKIHKPEDLVDCVGSPTAEGIDSLAPAAAELLTSRGRRYLSARFSGQTADIGALYAYQRRRDHIERAELCRRFGWDPRKRIVAVYASNWFDFPHGCGMTQFTDFLDWLNATITTASEATHVNWLFKAHPCDEWYGGVTLSDLLKVDAPPHIRLADLGWNGAALMQAVDAVVTVLGTAGLEFAALGKPVLVADRGWYHDAGFVVWPRTRDEYLAALRRNWWEQLDPTEQKRRADIFAGWYFGYPEWQGGLLLHDDSEQGILYSDYLPMLAAERPTLAREIDSIKRWWRSPHRHYHVWKVAEEIT
jgi:hypothetical protein